MYHVRESFCTSFVAAIPSGGGQGRELEGEGRGKGFFAQRSFGVVPRQVQSRREKLCPSIFFLFRGRAATRGCLETRGDAPSSLVPQIWPFWQGRRGMMGGGKSFPAAVITAIIYSRIPRSAQHIDAHSCINPKLSSSPPSSSLFFPRRAKTSHPFSLRAPHSHISLRERLPFHSRENGSRTPYAQWGRGGQQSAGDSRRFCTYVRVCTSDRAACLSSVLVHTTNAVWWSDGVIMQPPDHERRPNMLLCVQYIRTVLGSAYYTPAHPTLSLLLSWSSGDEEEGPHLRPLLLLTLQQVPLFARHC